MKMKYSMVSKIGIPENIHPVILAIPDNSPPVFFPPKTKFPSRHFSGDIKPPIPILLFTAFT